MIAAGLGSLTVEDSSVTSVARDGFKSIAATGKEQRSDSSWSDGTVNCWSVLHDVSSCLESPITSGSPSGYALDAASTHTMMSIPPPPINVACHLPYERLQQIAIPSTEEYLELKAGAIALPPLYLRSTLENNIKLNRIRDQLVQYSQSHSVTDNETSSSGKAFGSDNTMECDSQPTSAKVLSLSSNVPSQRSDTVTESGTSEHVKKAGPSIPGLKLTSLPHSEEMHSSLPAVPSLSLLPPTFNKAFLVSVY